jgi:hypothetical protein
MQHFKTLVFCSFLLVANLLVAQAPADSVAVPLRSLKIPVSDLVDPFGPAFMLSFEHRVAMRWSAMLEGGYVTNFNGRFFNRDITYGYKLRAEIRRYISLKDPELPKYFALQYMWRTTTTPAQKGVFCTGDCPPGHTRVFAYDYFKRVQTAHLALGFLVKNKRRLIWDFEFFAGLRWRNPEFLRVPEGAQFRRDYNKLISFRKADADILPSLGCAVRVGFRM